ncbi:MAG: hypothetical protein NC337_04605 [Roseburia sp.]|nr:hypothetical protein [Roseburia sp.]
MLTYGENIWDFSGVENEIELFKEVWDRRPIIDNKGGMSSNHMFWTWYAMKRLNPKYIIESGVWKGQGTWLLQEACPDAKIFSIDINLDKREYKSEDVTYYSDDFSCIDWSQITDKENTVIFFDDHQNAYNRLLQMKFMGFRKAFFEDNYPVGHGDCYSLKQILEEGCKGRPHEYGGGYKAHAVYVKNNVHTYFEFPPIYKLEQVRWGESWTQESFPTRKPVLTEIRSEMQRVLYEEAKGYTWICYCELKGRRNI